MSIRLVRLLDLFVAILVVALAITLMLIIFPTILASPVSPPIPIEFGEPPPLVIMP